MSIPLSRLPSLDLVRGFVAVGRRMSITLAAEDLCLTQSAVSRQIHGIEEILGVKLLVRGHRSIAFTAAGERLFRSADGAVQQLQDVFATLITYGATVAEFFNLDLSYAPPFSTTKDPVHYTGMILDNALNKGRKLITAEDLKKN